MALPLKSAVSDDPRSIALEPDSFTGDHWVLSFATDDGERVEVSLSPGALDQLTREACSVPAEALQDGRSATCDLCEETVDLFLAVPTTLGRPVHRDCYTEEYGAEWVSEHD